MKAIILSAGQGSRLLPLTANQPKCLLRLGERTILATQVEELAAVGVREILVVTGFCAGAVERELEHLARPGLTLRTLFNPFYAVADNLGSCWIARNEMADPFLLVNGDTVFERAIPARLLTEATSPITLTIDRKAAYDGDDMKVVLDGTRLVEVGKNLGTERIDGESIGMSLYRGPGPRLFVQALDDLMRGPAGTRSWYLRAIDLLARRGRVGVVSIEGLRWSEIDFPHDLHRASALFAQPARRALLSAL
ncbi:NTP transferase domain-containing protein [Benzoatithermus flavus]|uniref:Phosphocholine cytidylyltransferase family protein n=1 Tax=Benzoatithermus flavus TaxID=3108223 RepID=A0ABU8XX05_9PROT